MPNYLHMELRYRKSGEQARERQQGREGTPGY